MISVLIPALNEERNLRTAVLGIIEVAKRCGDIPLDLIVINDGSTDNTADVAEQLAREFPFIRVVHHPKNTGLGSCLRESIQLARHEKLCLLPGDGAIGADFVRQLFVNAQKADLVCGYILNTEYRPQRRHVLSCIFSLIYTTTFGLHIKYINSATLFPVARLRQLKIRARRYSVFAELHVKLLRTEVTFYEVAGTMNPRVAGKSSAIALKNLLEVVSSFVRLLVEVYVTSPKQYSGKPRRVLPDA